MWTRICNKIIKIVYVCISLVHCIMMNNYIACRNIVLVIVLFTLAHSSSKRIHCSQLYLLHHTQWYIDTYMKGRTLPHYMLIVF